jgi:acyl-CoA dehydrogenase
MILSSGPNRAAASHTPDRQASDIGSMEFDSYLEAIRRFTEEELIPAEAETTREGRVPEPLVERMRALGLFGISLPREYGGLGWSMLEQVKLTMAFTRASAVFRSRFSTTIGLCSQTLLEYGTLEQREALLPGMARGETTAAFCLTEESAGSDASNIATRAERTGDHYVINGDKRYITNAPIADLYLVMAKTVTNEAEDMSVFLVPRNTPGVVPGSPYRMMGQRGSDVGGVQFQNLRVPASALLGGREGNGLKMSLRGINHARTHVAAAAVGQATRLLDEALAYANKREQFGEKISSFQAIQVLLGESFAELAAARALVLDVAARFDRKPLPHVDVAAAKLFATEMVGRVADRAVQILGGQGYMEDQPVCRMYRDVRLLRLFEGTSQINQINIAKAMIRRGSV